MLRALETSDPLDRYLELKAEIQTLTEELDALKPEITAALWEEPEHRTLYKGHEIVLGERTCYEYSDAVAQLEKELKAIKLMERARGIAQVKRHSSFPVVKAMKQVYA